jgi:Importin-beta N-terminal domain
MFSFLMQSRKAAEDSLKACQTSAGYTDVLIAIISSDAPSAIRLVAVIILRSMVKSNWKASRGSNIRVVTTEEKQRIRDFLIGPVYCNEAEDSVALQIAVTTAKVSYAMQIHMNLHRLHNRYYRLTHARLTRFVCFACYHNT